MGPGTVGAAQAGPMASAETASFVHGPHFASYRWSTPWRWLRHATHALIHVPHPIGARSKRQREPGARGFRYGASWGQHERQNGSAVHFSVRLLVPVSK